MDSVVEIVDGFHHTQRGSQEVMLLTILDVRNAFDSLC